MKYVLTAFLLIMILGAPGAVADDSHQNSTQMDADQLSEEVDQEEAIGLISQFLNLIADVLESSGELVREGTAILTEDT